MAKAKSEVETNLVGKKIIPKYLQGAKHLWEWQTETKSAEITAVWLDDERNLKALVVNQAGETKVVWISHYNILKEGGE